MAGWAASRAKASASFLKRMVKPVIEGFLPTTTASFPHMMQGDERSFVVRSPSCSAPTSWRNSRERQNENTGAKLDSHSN
jgi:hypothetical protein